MLQNIQTANIEEISLLLTANVTPFTVAKWYVSATGGTSFYSGNTYTAAPRSSNITYYVSANTPNNDMAAVGFCNTGGMLVLLSQVHNQ